MFYDTVSSNDANKSVNNYLLTKRLSKRLGLLIAGTVVSAECIDVLFSLLFSQCSTRAYWALFLFYVQHFYHVL